MKTPSDFLNKIIAVDIYNTEVMLHFGSIKSLKKVLKKYQQEKFAQEISVNLKEPVLGQTYFNEKYGTILIYMPEIPSTSEQYATLTHELLHATNFVLKKVGVLFCDESEEAFAYLLGFLTKRTFEIISSYQSL